MDVRSEAMSTTLASLARKAEESFNVGILMKQLLDEYMYIYIWERERETLEAIKH